MSIFDRSCIWCGKNFELEAHDNDADSFNKEMKEHTEYCKIRLESKKKRKLILKQIEGLELNEAKGKVKELLEEDNGNT